MSLAQLVQSNTQDGHTIIDFLIDVMHGRLNHFKPCHRLSAARMLIIYGHQDADDFITDNSPADPFTRPATRRSLRIAGVNPELARLVKSQTDGGRSIIDFIVAVMEGRIREARPHHRMAAARDLLERGFGKLPHRRLPTPPKPFRSPHTPPAQLRLPRQHLISRRNPERPDLPRHRRPRPRRHPSGRSTALPHHRRTLSRRHPRHRHRSSTDRPRRHHSYPARHTQS